MKESTRPSLEVSRPLFILWLECHTWQISNLIGVISRTDMKHGEQTQPQQPADKHGSKVDLNNLKKIKTYTAANYFKAFVVKATRNVM